MNKVKHLISVVMLGGVSISSMAFEISEVTRTDRYTTVSIEVQSDQAKPLSTITSVSMGKDIVSVGDAIQELLKGSGYRWQSQAGEDQLLHDFPLPAVARTIGPIRLVDALQTLAGDAWVIQTDHFNRVVWFEKYEAVQIPATFME